MSHCGGFSCEAKALGKHRLQWLWHVGSIVIIHRISCPAAYGIFLEQGSNPASWSRWIFYHCTTRETLVVFHCVYVPHLLWGFVGGAVVKYLPANAEEPRDAVSITESRRSLEKGMATHSSILAWKIPWTEEPGGLQTMGLHSRTRLSAHIHTLTHTTSSLSIHLLMDI